MDAGAHTPLAVINKELKDFRLLFHGDRSKTMLPQRRPQRRSSGTRRAQACARVQEDYIPHLLA